MPKRCYVELTTYTVLPVFWETFYCYCARSTRQLSVWNSTFDRQQVMAERTSIGECSGTHLCNSPFNGPYASLAELRASNQLLQAQMPKASRPQPQLRDH